MIQTEFLIVGQGIAGSLLAFELLKRGREVMIFDTGGQHTSSRCAAAVINPVNIRTGQPLPASGHILETALDTYRQLEAFLDLSFLEKKALLLFLKDGMQLPMTPGALLEPCNASEQALLRCSFSGPGTVQKVYPVWQVHYAYLEREWRIFLHKSHRLRQEAFIHDRCRATDAGVIYGDIQAEKIIFCEGAAGSRNPFFRGQAFTANRGNALLLSIPGLPSGYIYHYQKRLVPLVPPLFWYGSNYQWRFRNMDPDPEWRAVALGDLDKWLRLPYRLEDHLVAERPTTAGQRIILERHPECSRMFMFNGLGTKGFTAAPYYARKSLELLQVQA